MSFPGLPVSNIYEHIAGLEVSELRYLAIMTSYGFTQQTAYVKLSEWAWPVYDPATSHVVCSRVILGCIFKIPG
jgi:hypothetical protein